MAHCEKTQEILDAVKAHLEENQPHMFGATAGGALATALDLLEKFGPSAVKFALTFIPATSSATKFIPVVLDLLGVLQAHGIVSPSDPAPAA